jgi:hypothetical protein
VLGRKHPNKFPGKRRLMASGNYGVQVVSFLAQEED